MYLWTASLRWVSWAAELRQPQTRNWGNCNQSAVNSAARGLRKKSTTHPQLPPPERKRRTYTRQPRPRPLAHCAAHRPPPVAVSGCRLASPFRRTCALFALAAGCFLTAAVSRSPKTLTRTPAIPLRPAAAPSYICAVVAHRWIWPSPAHSRSSRRQEHRIHHGQVKERRPLSPQEPQRRWQRTRRAAVQLQLRQRGGRIADETEEEGSVGFCGRGSWAVCQAGESPRC